MEDSYHAGITPYSGLGSRSRQRLAGTSRVSQKKGKVLRPLGRLAGALEGEGGGGEREADRGIYFGDFYLGVVELREGGEEGVEDATTEGL